ncbi:MAG TPA: transaldolase family protein, partial [Bradyrhizobium sp.]|nr:transaldolase family protein [Bradyrhizobium sp.]
GLSPDIRSVASLFISRWDRAVADKVGAPLKNRLGLAIGKAAYKAYRDQLDSDRWQRLANLGARAQRLLFASTGTKDPSAPDTLYVNGLAAPNTVNTMPEGTLKASAEHGTPADVLQQNGGGSAQTLGEFEKAGVGIAALAEKLQNDGAESFVQSWRELLQAIDAKSTKLRQHAGA